MERTELFYVHFALGTTLTGDPNFLNAFPEEFLSASLKTFSCWFFALYYLIFMSLLKKYEIDEIYSGKFLY